MNTLLVFTPTWIDPATGEDAILPECAASIKAQALGEGVDDFDWHVTTDNPFPVGDHRNVLHQYQRAREWFLNNKRYAALLTVEQDNVLPDPQTFQKMWATPGDVIYAPYMLRHGRERLNTYRYVGDQQLGDSLTFHPRELSQARTLGVHRVSGAGFGCTLFHRRALEAIEFRPSSLMNPCPDLSFALDALYKGLVSNGRFDVAVEHLDGRRRLQSFTPERQDTYSALRSKTVLACGRVIQLKQGQPVQLSDPEAAVLLRAGYINE